MKRDATELLGDAGRWAELTDTQRWALQQMVAAKDGIIDRNAFGSTASDRRRGTTVLKSLEALGLAVMGGWFDFPNCALTDAGRALIPSSRWAELKPYQQFVLTLLSSGGQHSISTPTREVVAVGGGFTRNFATRLLNQLKALELVDADHQDGRIAVFRINAAGKAVAAAGAALRKEAAGSAAPTSD